MCNYINSIPGSVSFFCNRSLVVAEAHSSQSGIRVKLKTSNKTKNNGRHVRPDLDTPIGSEMLAITCLYRTLPFH